MRLNLDKSKILLFGKEVRVDENLMSVLSLYNRLTLPKQQILDSSKQEEIADNNFKFDENGRKFSKWLANNVGKGKIAFYEQFFLFPHCFQKTGGCEFMILLR